MKLDKPIVSYSLVFLFVLTFHLLNTDSILAQGCTQNSDCGYKELCVAGGKCVSVECTQDSHCSVTGQCIETEGKCVKCTTDSHCSASFNACLTYSNPIHNRCGCSTDNDCSDGQHCYNNSCYVCANNNHCSGQLNICTRNPSNPRGICVECTSNIHCNVDQICDTLTNSCKITVKQPESQISPDKYPNKYKGKSPKKLQTAPEIQKQQNELEKVNPKKVSPKDMK